MKDLINIEEIELARINVWDENPREITPEARAGLRASMERFGLVEPIVVNRSVKAPAVNVATEALFLVSGHQRLDLLLADGHTHARCVVVEISDAEAKALAITLNNKQIQGDFTAHVAVLIDKLKADLGSSTATELRLEELRAEVAAAQPTQGGGVRGLEATPQAPKVPVTEPGDLWTLGKHRLLCGDSTSKEDVTRLLGRAKPRLMITDPPYGVNYDPAWRNEAGVSKTKRTGKVANDDRASWAMAYALFPGDVAYVWHAGKYASSVERSLASCGFEIRSQIIWVKRRFALSRGQYHWRHEPCWYAVREGGDPGWAGDRKQQTVWADIVDHFDQGPDSGKGWPLFAAEVDEEKVLAFAADRTTVWEIGGKDATGKTTHGTQKPVECMERPMRNHEGDVYEPFSGSGTTIMAAHIQGRRCYAMELDPRYCDVAVQRWEQFTGRKAKRAKAPKKKARRKKGGRK